MASDRPIIIKKIKKGGDHGHHGGAWKVAYADFVTAMMAFFLLMWLINTTTPEQRQGIADYFAPASVSPTNSGGGGILAGTALGDGGSGRGASSTIERLSPDAQDDPQTPEETSEQSSQSASAEAMAAARERREQQSQFASAEMSLRQSLQEMPELAELTRQLIIEETPEGLRIQLVDEEGRPMFNPGSVQPNERAVVLLRAVADIAQQLPNRIAISGHTDSGPAPGDTYTNWDLSADRANAARAILQSGGIPDDRVAEVTGRAGSEPLYPDDPYMAGNRRISILLLREAPVIAPGHGLNR